MFSFDCSLLSVSGLEQILRLLGSGSRKNSLRIQSLVLSDIWCLDRQPWLPLYLTGLLLLFTLPDSHLLLLMPVLCMMMSVLYEWQGANSLHSKQNEKTEPQASLQKPGTENSRQVSRDLTGPTDSSEQQITANPAKKEESKQKFLTRVLSNRFLDGRVSSKK